jgi:hypothetical protein
MAVTQAGYRRAAGRVDIGSPVCINEIDAMASAGRRQFRMDLAMQDSCHDVSRINGVEARMDKPLVIRMQQMLHPCSILKQMD